jgi:ankyrin repeat protein
MVTRHRGRPLAALLALLLLAASASELPPVVQAAKDRDLDELRRLVEAGADVAATAPDGATALHWAAYWDDVEAADVLIRAGADARAANDLGATPLWNASLNGSPVMVRRLLEAGADPNAALESGETALMTAARTGSGEVISLLLAAGALIDARGTRDQTALMWAVSQRHPEAVRVLLEHGADVHARSATWSQVMAVPPHADASNQQIVPHGAYTPLLFAARVGDLASTILLVRAGADVDAADAWGVSAVTLAAHSGFGPIVQFLLDEGADPNAMGAGFSALHLAVLRRDEPLARVLLAHGADPNARLATWTPTRRASADWHIHPSLVGATPFWLAARLSQPGMMRLLAEQGADPRFVHEVHYVALAGTFGAEGRTEATTALMAAVGMGGPRRLEAFVEAPPSELAALRLEAVQVALDLGIDPDAVDLEGRTALDRAGDRAIVELLTAHTATR